MTSTQTAPDLSTLTGKRVTLTYTPKGEDGPLTLEGRVEIGSEIGLMFKEKGKSNVTIVEADSIVSVEELAPKEPNVSTKTLQPIPLGRVRQHLADRHGWTKADANALTEAQAAEQHDALDHGVLAHKHEEPKAKVEADVDVDSDGDED